MIQTRHRLVQEKKTGPKDRRSGGLDPLARALGPIGQSAGDGLAEVLDLEQGDDVLDLAAMLDPSDVVVLEGDAAGVGSGTP